MTRHRRRIPPPKGGSPKRKRGKKLPNPRKEDREKEDALVRRLMSGDYKYISPPSLSNDTIEDSLKPHGITISEFDHLYSAFIAEFPDDDVMSRQWKQEVLSSIVILLPALKRWRKGMPINDRIYQQVIPLVKAMNDPVETEALTGVPMARSARSATGESLQWNQTTSLLFAKQLIDCGLVDPQTIVLFSFLLVQSEVASQLIASDLKLEGREIVLEYHKLPWGNGGKSDETDCNLFFSGHFKSCTFEDKMDILCNKRVRQPICSEWFKYTLSSMLDEADWPDSNTWKEYALAIGMIFGLPKERYLPFFPELVGVTRRWRKDTSLSGQAASEVWASELRFSYRDEYDALMADTTMDPRDWMFRYSCSFWMSHMTDSDSCPIIWTEKTVETLREATDGMERPEELGRFDSSLWEGWSRYCWETGVSRRRETAFLKQQQSAMSFVVDADTRALISNQGLPSRIHPEFMHLPYPSMYLDVRIPLPSGKLLEGVFIQEIDDTPWENHREGCGGRAVAFNMNTCETFEVPTALDITRGGEPLMLIGGSALHSQGHASVFEDIRRRWVVKYIETNGVERTVESNELEISTWGDDPVFPTRPRKSGDTKDYRAVVDFIIGLLLFIQLPDVEWIDVGQKGTAKSIRKREAKREREGMPPLPQRRVIQLSGEVKRYVNRIASAEGSGTRYHQVRGHLRTLRSERYKEENRGKVIWVKSHHKGWGSDSVQEYEVKR